MVDESLAEVSTTLQLLRSDYETLKEKYDDEFSLRKRLYNQVIELKGNIRVFCRCRPLNLEELASRSSSIVGFNSSQETELDIVSGDSVIKRFKFDHVFRPQDNQEAIFAETSPVVTSVLDGYNVCIFAYGQTGTGKTFTMEGTPDNRGVNYRTLEELFQISKERSATLRYSLFVSMLEVYNEKIRDLLIEDSNQPTKKLEIKQSAEGTQEIPGLVEAHVHSIEEVWELLKTGSRSRSVGSTNANELSSRSHCLLRVTVNGESLVNGPKTRSHLWLVDLAGSERLGRTESEGDRLKESLFINKSLSALGDVISALSSKTAHIPYRNSKLTHLLQSSLGGDCKTLMFVQISPSLRDMGESLCSLNFASRVRGIEHGRVSKQVDPEHLHQCKQLVDKLRYYEKETPRLLNSLQSLELRLAAREQLCRSLLVKTQNLEDKLSKERKDRCPKEIGIASSSAKLSSLPFYQQNQNALKVNNLLQRSLKMRPPLGSITNITLPPVTSSKLGITQSTALGPRHVSITKRPTGHQPRRVSIVTDYTSYMTPPLHISTRKLQCRTTQSTALGPRHVSITKRPTGHQPRRVSIVTDYTSYMTPPLHISTRKLQCRTQPRVGASDRKKHPRDLLPSRLSHIWK